MFEACENLTTIYAGDGRAAEDNGNYDVFTGCTRLQGAVAYNSSKTDAGMANWGTGYLAYKAN